LKTERRLTVRKTQKSSSKGQRLVSVRYGDKHRCYGDAKQKADACWGAKMPPTAPKENRKKNPGNEQGKKAVGQDLSKGDRHRRPRNWAIPKSDNKGEPRKSPGNATVVN